MKGRMKGCYDLTDQNFLKEKGKTYSHILNPKTGRPVTHHLYSVTVMHEDPVWANAWNTALLCLGEQEAIHIAEAEHLKVILIYEKSKSLQSTSAKPLQLHRYLHMRQLRHKIEADPARPRYLLTEAGIGYRLFEEENR
jgi:hypothetical protein